MLHYISHKSALPVPHRPVIGLHAPLVTLTVTLTISGGAPLSFLSFVLRDSVHVTRCQWHVPLSNDHSWPNCFPAKNGAPVEEQRMPHFPLPVQHHQMRVEERAKSGSPTSLGGISYAPGRHCGESGAEGSASHKGEQSWDHPWPQVIVSFVTLPRQSQKKRKKNGRQSSTLAGS